MSIVTILQIILISDKSLISLHLIEIIGKCAKEQKVPAKERQFL